MTAAKEPRLTRLVRKAQTAVDEVLAGDESVEEQAVALSRIALYAQVMAAKLEVKGE